MTISPAAAVSAGAMWNVDGGTWQASGTTVSGITVGSHTVAFNNIAGWNTPAKSVCQHRDRADYLLDRRLRSTNRLPDQSQSALLLRLAQERNGTWMEEVGRGNGTIIGPSRLEREKDVAFNNIAGWNTPANQTANIASGQTTSLTTAWHSTNRLSNSPQMGLQRLLAPERNEMSMVGHGRSAGPRSVRQLVHIR